MRYGFLIFTLFVSACYLSDNRDPRIEMSAVERFNVENFKGEWYEIARIPNPYENNCFASKFIFDEMETKDTEESADTKNNVQNATQDDAEIEYRITLACHKGAIDGPENQEIGRARIADEEGKFFVTFVPLYLDPDPNFWILANKKYEILIVGEPTGSTGWILARKPKLSERDLNWALSVMRANGYNMEHLIMVPQS